jgi:hypothetical protein
MGPRAADVGTQGLRDVGTADYRKHAERLKAVQAKAEINRSKADMLKAVQAKAEKLKG